MSQISFRTRYMGFPVRVVSGWDGPLKYYHFTIFDLRVDAENETIVSCLDEKDPFSAKTTKRWRDKLKRMKIDPPNGFWERVELCKEDDLYEFKT